MSVVEVTPERPFERPPANLESHLLARIPFAESICLAGITAAMDNYTKVPSLRWAMRTESGLIFPAGTPHDMYLSVSEVASVDLDPDLQIEPEDILGLPRLEHADSLLWTSAKAVVSVIKNNKAQLRITN